MKNEIITIQNMRGYLDQKGTAWLNLEDSARGLGFTQMKDKKEYIRWDRVIKYLEEVGFPQQVGKEYHEAFIPENAFYLLAFKGENEAAVKFQQKVANEILPEIRKNGHYSSKPVLNPNRSSFGDLASLMKEWRMWAKEMKMPYCMAMKLFVDYMKTKGEDIPLEMVYVSPFNFTQINIFDFQKIKE